MENKENKQPEFPIFGFGDLADRGSGERSNEDETEKKKKRMEEDKKWKIQSEKLERERQEKVKKKRKLAWKTFTEFIVGDAFFNDNQIQKLVYTMIMNNKTDNEIQIICKKIIDVVLHQTFSPTRKCLKFIDHLLANRVYGEIMERKIWIHYFMNDISAIVSRFGAVFTNKEIFEKMKRKMIRREFFGEILRKSQNFSFPFKKLSIATRMYVLEYLWNYKFVNFYFLKNLALEKVSLYPYNDRSLSSKEPRDLLVRGLYGYFIDVNERKPFLLFRSLHFRFFGEKILNNTVKTKVNGFQYVPVSTRRVIFSFVKHGHKVNGYKRGKKKEDAEFVTVVPELVEFNLNVLKNSIEKISVRGKSLESGELSTKIPNGNVRTLECSTKNLTSKFITSIFSSFRKLRELDIVVQELSMADFSKFETLRVFFLSVEKKKEEDRQDLFVPSIIFPIFLESLRLRFSSRYSLTYETIRNTTKLPNLRRLVLGFKKFSLGNFSVFQTLLDGNSSLEYLSTNMLPVMANHYQDFSFTNTTLKHLRIEVTKGPLNSYVLEEIMKNCPSVETLEILPELKKYVPLHEYKYFEASRFYMKHRTRDGPGKNEGIVEYEGKKIFCHQKPEDLNNDTSSSRLPPAEIPGVPPEWINFNSLRSSFNLVTLEGKVKEIVNKQKNLKTLSLFFLEKGFFDFDPNFGSSKTLQRLVLHTGRCEIRFSNLEIPTLKELTMIGSHISHEFLFNYWKKTTKPNVTPRSLVLPDLLNPCTHWTDVRTTQNGQLKNLEFLKELSRKKDVKLIRDVAFQKNGETKTVSFIGKEQKSSKVVEKEDNWVKKCTEAWKLKDAVFGDYEDDESKWKSYYTERFPLDMTGNYDDEEKTRGKYRNLVRESLDLIKCVTPEEREMIAKSAYISKIVKDRFYGASYTCILFGLTQNCEFIQISFDMHSRSRMYSFEYHMWVKISDGMQKMGKDDSEKHNIKKSDETMLISKIYFDQDEKYSYELVKPQYFIDTFRKLTGKIVTRKDLPQVIKFFFTVAGMGTEIESGEGEADNDFDWIYFCYNRDYEIDFSEADIKKVSKEDWSNILIQKGSLERAFKTPTEMRREDEGEDQDGEGTCVVQ